MNLEELCTNISVSLLSGIISGVISSLIVYFVTKNRERKYRTYAYWESFLFHALNRFGIEVPTEALEYLTDVGDNGSRWHKAMNNVMDILYKPNVESREITDEEEKLFNNVGIALDELSKWAKANKLSSKKRKS